MKKVFLLSVLFLLFSCWSDDSNTEWNIDNNIINDIIERDVENDNSIVEDTNNDIVNEESNDSEDLKDNSDDEKLSILDKLDDNINIVGNISLAKKIELLNSDEELKNTKLVNADINIKSGDINIIKGDNDFEYWFKYIKNYWLELCWTWLSDNIKSITITPIDYTIVNNKDSSLELKSSKISSITNTEPFTLTQYRQWNKNFLYAWIYYFKLFSKQWANYEIKYELIDWTVDKDYIFIKWNY